MLTRGFLSDVVDGTTCLSAIFWKEVSQDSKLLQGWHFEQDSASGQRVRVGLEKEVKNLPVRDSTRTVYLVAG